jgi:acyl-CoA dehydrogenase
MDFAYSPKVEALRERLLTFMAREIAPANKEWHAIAAEHRYPMDLVERLKAKAYEEGLWNLFLPGLREGEPGTRLSNLEYAPLAEIMGRYPWA